MVFDAVIQLPPSTTMVSPDMNDAAGDTMNRVRSATSCLVPRRPTGIVEALLLTNGPARKI